MSIKRQIAHAFELYDLELLDKQGVINSIRNVIEEEKQEPICPTGGNDAYCVENHPLHKHLHIAGGISEND